MTVEWSLTVFCLISIAVPASAISLLGYVCAPRRATKTYLGTLVSLCFGAAAAYTYQIYLGNGPTHYEPIGPEFVGSGSALWCCTMSWAACDEIV